MDLVTVTGYKSVAELMSESDGMDSFEYQCWLSYWKENIFGPWSNNYLMAQIANFTAVAFGGGSVDVPRYMARVEATKKPEPMSYDDEIMLSYKMMSEFRGKDKADVWLANINKNMEN